MDDDNVRAARAKRGSPFLTTMQAAQYICLKPATLERLRVVGGGPKFRKHGRYILYHIRDLDHWSHSRTHETTSDDLPDDDLPDDKE